MEDGKSVTDHVNTFNMLVVQLTSVGVKMEEEDRCIRLLCSLPNLWDHLVMAIRSTNTTFKMDEVVSSLLSKEMRRKSSESAKEVLVVHARSKEKGKKKDKKEEKGRSKSRGRSKSPRKSKALCWNYGKPGHFRKECKEEKKKKKKNHDSNSDKSSQDEGEAFVTALVMHASKDVWLIESVASFHMTSHWG